MADQQNDLVIALDNTIRAFEDGIANLSTDAAISVLDGWTDRLNRSGRKDVEGIAVLLQQIAGLLQNDPVPKAQIGDLLKRVGAHTSEVASTVEPELQERLKKLGGLCTAAGHALTGGGSAPPYASYHDDPAADNLQSRTKADDLADSR